MSTILDPDLEARLVDPETRAPLRPATEEEVGRLVAGIRDGTVRRRDGERPVGVLDGAYVDEAVTFAYPVLDGLATFLVEERLEVPPPSGQ